MSFFGEGASAGGEQGRPALSRAPAWVWDIVAYAPAMVCVPLGALGISALAGKGPLRSHKWLGGLIAAGATAGLLRWQLERVFTEQPQYTVERVSDGLEVRRYQPRLVAETTVHDKEWEAALDEGFHRLAGYIFGANEGSRKIAMTAPVNVEPEAGQKIAMTAPVTAHPEGEGLIVTFTMPKKFDLSTLPQPTDARIRLREREGERVAALRFRGTYSGPKTEAMEEELLRRVREAGLEPAGAPVFAGYDAPSTLPFLRRVELWVPVA